MACGPIQKAAQTLELILRLLPEDSHFIIVSFGSSFDSLFPENRPYSEENFNRALELARQMDANYLAARRCFRSSIGCSKTPIVRCRQPCS